MSSICSGGGRNILPRGNVPDPRLVRQTMALAIRLFAASGLALFAMAQSTAPEAPTTIRVDVTEIVVPVTALDRDNQPVAGLKPQQFRLVDNGKEQDIKVDAIYNPVSLVVAIQANSSVEAVLPQVRKIGSLLEAQVVGDQGEAAVIAFDHRIRVMQEFTSEADKISQAVAKINPGSSSSRMIDAVQQATRMLRSRPKNRRRIILLVSETRDIASESRMRETLIETQLSNVNIYTVNISRVITTLTGKPQPPRPLAQPPAAYSMPSNVPATPTTVAQKTGAVGNSGDVIPLMVELFRDVKAIFVSNPAELFTKGTGGAEFSFVKQRGLEDAISRIGGEIHSQYILDYSPSNKLDGGSTRSRSSSATRGSIRSA